MDVQACLDRIQYAGALDRSYETLCSLQRAFLLRVAFENLDIHLGRRIQIDPDAVFRKVVRARRGGFCYELNGLFHDLLAALGFRASFLGARMMRDGRLGREMGHMVVRVDLDQPYLVDVGNGKSFREPLRLDGENESPAEDFRYRIAGTALGPAVLEKPAGGDWRTRFVFDLEPRRREDFAEACDWTETSSESIFTRNRICTLAREKGRVTLMNSVLQVSDETGSKEIEIPPGAYEDCLKTHFGIVIG